MCRIPEYNDDDDEDKHQHDDNVDDDDVGDNEDDDKYQPQSHQGKHQGRCKHCFLVRAQAWLLLLRRISSC